MDAKVPSRVGTRRAYAQAGSQAGGGLIHYRYAGPDSGRSPLMLLHPFPSSSDVFEAFMLEMGRDRTVIAPDLPGYGMSDAPDDPPSIADYASAMLTLEAKLGLGMLDVMGYHAGGTIAAEMARQQPIVVRKIVTVAFMMTPEERAGMGKGDGENPLETRASGFHQGWTNFKTNFWRMGKDETRAWNLYVEAQRNPHTSSWGFRAIADYDLAHTLETLTQPILVLDPEDDAHRFTARAGAHLKNGRVHPLPGWTHGFLDAEAQETGRIVRRFLDG